MAQSRENWRLVRASVSITTQENVVEEGAEKILDPEVREESFCLRCSNCVFELRDVSGMPAKIKLISFPAWVVEEPMMLEP